MCRERPAASPVTEPDSSLRVPVNGRGDVMDEPGVPSFVSVPFTQKPGGNLSPSDTDALVKLFNDQVAKLEAI
jgi:hypothetical protein